MTTVTIGARALLVSLLALAPCALAQPGGAGTLPEAIVTSQSLGAPEQGAIERFVAGLADKLSDPAPGVREDARDRLLAPLSGASGEPSVKFRIEYSKALGKRIEPLVRSKDQGVALAAIRIAGALASQAGADACIAALADPRPAVRRMAASGLGETLATDPRKSVVPEQRVSAIIEALERALGTEQDLLVVDGIVLALGSPTEPGLRARSLRAIFRGVGRQAATHMGAGRMTESEIGVLLRAVKLARDTVINPNVDKTLAADAAVLAGHTLALALDQLTVATDSGQRPAPESTALDDLAIASEATVILGHLATRNENVESKVQDAFPRAMASGQLDSVRRAIMQWVGPQGRLTQAPYSVKSDAFLKPPAPGSAPPSGG